MACSDAALRRAVEGISFDGEFIKAEPYGNGHINDTYAAYFRQPDGTVKRYILQRINTSIFKDPDALMRNIAGVTSFLKEKIIVRGGDYTRETLNIIPTRDGKTFLRTDAGCFRGYLFIEGATTYQTVEKPSDFYNSARAFGKFQNLLSDYPADTLNETIPDFHNTVKRFEAFDAAVKKDCMGLAKTVQKEIDFAYKHRDDCSVLVNALSEGDLPLRVTHNDTKLNNVMIDDKTGEGIAVIDLDTVMPGLSLYDFGDSIRFGASTAAEDERDLDKVQMSIDLYRIYLRGFLETAGSALTDSELELMPMGAKLMTFECGIRFLADYLSGDVYFKVHREGHNLDRARTQFKLVADMERQWDDMCKSVKLILK